MTVPPWAFLTRLKSARSARTKASRRCGPISTLKGVLGAAAARLEELAGVGEAAQHLARPAQGGAHAADDLARAGGALAPGVAEQLQVGRLGARRPLRWPHRRVVGLLLEVEEDGGDVDAGDAVDQRVVALADTAKRSPSKPLDQPQLPERLGAVELLGEDPRGEVAQLLLGAGRGQGRAAHVVVEVEEGVVDPDRPALVEGDAAQLLAEAGDEVQARLDVVAEFLVRGRRAVEDDRRGDVHVGAASLQVEEGGVESGESVPVHWFHLRMRRPFR